MKTLNIAGKKVSVNIEKLSKGMHQMHAENEDMKAVLAFGMLDANLCEMFEKNLMAGVKSQFCELNNELFKERIESFVKDCNNEIAKGVYSLATMVV